MVSFVVANVIVIGCCSFKLRCFDWSFVFSIGLENLQVVLLAVVAVGD